MQAKTLSGAGARNGAKVRRAGKAKEVPKSTASVNGAKRLRPGELDGLVLFYMCKNEKELPMTEA